MDFAHIVTQAALVHGKLGEPLASKEKEGRQIDSLTGLF